MTIEAPMAWPAARAAAHAAGLAARPAPVAVPLADADGRTLAEPLYARTDLPPFRTSSVDGYATRGTGPWRLVGRVLAGSVPERLLDGTAVEVATGAMLPAGADQVVRAEDAQPDADGRVSGQPRATRDWREPGDEATRGDQLFPAGSPVTPALVGLAAVCGCDTLSVAPAVRVGVVVFGDELLTSGLPGAGRVRDGVGPQLPAWLRRLGAEPVDGFAPLGPVEDTSEAQAAALATALAQADVVCTSGGTMRGAVDHLHAALAKLGARYLVDTVAVRPGFPMVLAEVPAPGGRPRFVVGLPGNPQSAVVTLVSLVAPLLDGLSGRPAQPPPTVRLAEPVRSRGRLTHLAAVRVGPDGAVPVRYADSSMLRGLAQADGFAVIAPGADAPADATVPWVPLPLPPGGRP